MLIVKLCEKYGTNTKKANESVGDLWSKKSLFWNVFVFSALSQYTYYEYVRYSMVSDDGQFLSEQSERALQYGGT